MLNPKFLQTAGRWMNKDIPEDNSKNPVSQKRTSSTAIPDFDYFFLGDELGKKVHEDVVRKYGSHAFVTNNVSYDKDTKLIRGSKPGYIVAVNEFLRNKNLRTATSYDVQKAIDEGKLNFSGVYEDLGLVLYSESGENEYLAKDLANQVKKRNGRLELPALFHLTGLELRVDKNAPEGMAFNLTDNSQIIQAQQLSFANDQKKFLKLNESGLPIFDDNGKHTFYAGNSGLRMLIRNRDSYLVARDGNLVDSDDDGRVLVCREAVRSGLGGK